MWGETKKGKKREGERRRVKGRGEKRELDGKRDNGREEERRGEKRFKWGLLLSRLASNLVGS